MLTVDVNRQLTTLHYYCKFHGQTLEEEYQVKYLWVTITLNLSWKPHVTNIMNKVSKTLGFIRQNIRTNSKSIKQAAYKALVRPTLEYAGTVWDPYTDENINAGKKIQRWAARWVGLAPIPTNIQCWRDALRLGMANTADSQDTWETHHVLQKSIMA